MKYVVLSESILAGSNKFDLGWVSSRFERGSAARACYHFIYFKKSISTMMRLLTLLSIILSSQNCVAFKAPMRNPVVTNSRTEQNSPSARPVFGTRSEMADPLDLPGNSLEPVVDGLTDVMVLGLRVGTCVLMVHHGIDKIEHVDGFTANVVDKFFGFLPGPGKFWTLSAAATQVAGAGLLGVGVLARPVALSMMATMVTAVTFHLLNTGAEGFPLGVPAAHSYNFELAAMYVAVLAYFSVAGAGAYSIDEKVLGGELDFYESLWNKVSSKKE